MDALKAKRNQIRRLYRRTAQDTNKKVKENQVQDLTIDLKYLEEKYEEIKTLDKKIQDMLDFSVLEETELEKEYDEADELFKLHLEITGKGKELLAPKVKQEHEVQIITKEARNHNLKVPKLIIREFNDDPKDWIGFWGQFKKINDDCAISDEDKFQYLIQSLAPGSASRKLVESYPPSQENYPKALNELRAKYSNDILIEVYIRELLNLMFSATTVQMKVSDLYNKLNTYVQALDSLGMEKEKYQCILYPLIESALPEDILVSYDRSQLGHKKQGSERLDALMSFLHHEVVIEDRVKMARGRMADIADGPALPTAAFVSKQKEQVRSFTNFKKDSCVYCDGDGHSINECRKFGNLSLDEMKEAIKVKNACFICLKMGHMAKFCKTFVKCMACSKRHMLVLCPELHKLREKSKTVNTDEGCDETGDEKAQVLSCHNSTTLLQTLVVRLENCGKSVMTRCLLDSGAQRSYVRRDIADTLALKTVRVEELKHALFGCAETAKEAHRCLDVQVSSIDNHFSFRVNVLEQKSLCGSLPKVKNTEIEKELKRRNIILTDLQADTNDEIGLLLGSDYLGRIMTNDIEHLDENLIAVKTKLGWTLQGPVPSASSFTSMVLHTSTQDLNIEELWSLELLGIKEPQIQNKEEDFLDNFHKTITIDNDGRYQVEMLWKTGAPKIKTGFEQAYKRLVSTTEKMQKSGITESYGAVFQEWLEEKIIEEVMEDDHQTGHYLAHHPIIKTTSTTKIRPVFDASVALNQHIYKGINLIDNIPKLLIMFRRGTYGVISDVRKAFLQLSVSEQDKNYLKFLWWHKAEDYPNTKLKTFRHRRVVFGIACSPFLLAATIKFHIEKTMTEENKNTAEILKNSLYVDNCITSFDSKEELECFIKEARELMLKGKFDLRGWVTSSERIDETTNTTVLGMLWNTIQDDMQCNVSLNKTIKEDLTKRDLLSITQHIFDPLGLVSPVTLVPKLIMQKAWLENTGWDEKIATELIKEFKNWADTLHFLNQCKFPRRLSSAPLDRCETSIHVFSDASQGCYAACVFLRTCYENKVDVQLIMAKSRVAPARKTLSLPRLELMGALIGSRLYVEVLKSGLLVQCKKYEVFCWTDSAVVLAWLKRDSVWKAFVSNRVEEILKSIKKENWHHLPRHDNPADLPSRGCNAKKLVETRWWEGPQWLKLEKDKWPKSKIIDVAVNESDVCIEEKKNTTVCVDSNIPKQSFSEKLMYFSKYNRIVRLVAWLLRMHPKIRKQYDIKGEITCDEYQNAETVLTKLLQKEDFEDIPKNLYIIRDEVDVLRVKTRLTLTNEDPNFIYPILLPGKNEIIQRMVRQRHELLCHAGAQNLMSDLRNYFWIAGIRCLVRQTIARCMICKRYKSKHYEVPEAPLPTDRVEGITPFQITGIDLAGPLYLRDKEKCWIVIFTCATYRAIHLELCSSLSTEDFMMALRRFIARRGRIETIWTDNGTNFHGLKNKLDTIDWETIMSSTSTQKINWRFIPPRAAWWGGWWERLVRVVKDMLRRILGKMSITWIELYTVLCDCESVINSRPLTYVETDSDSLRPLTPALFLHGLSNSETPDIDQIDSNGLNIRYKYLQKLREDFRQRFRSEYLALLTSKNSNKLKEPHIGDIVLIGSDTNRIHWPLGLIKEVYTGADGYTRVARVETANGERVRACQMLYPLELSSETPNIGKKFSGTPIKQSPDTGSDQTRSSGEFSTSDPKLNTLGKNTRCGRAVKVPKRFLD